MNYMPQSLLFLIPAALLEGWILYGYVSYLRWQKFGKLRTANPNFQMYLIRSLTSTFVSIFFYLIIWSVGSIQVASAFTIGNDIYFSIVLVNLSFLALFVLQIKQFSAIEKKQYLFTLLLKLLQIAILVLWFLSGSAPLLKVEL